MQDIEQIYKEHFETVNKYLFCLTHDANISEELAQETFYRAVKNIDKFKNNCKISTWLCKIAKNLWYDELKRNKKYEVLDDDILNAEIDNNPEEIVVSSDSKLEFYKKIQKLDKIYQDVIYLKITGELTFKEIGEVLNKSESWARVTFYRGKQKLKEVDNYEK